MKRKPRAADADPVFSDDVQTSLGRVMVVFSRSAIFSIRFVAADCGENFSSEKNELSAELPGAWRQAICLAAAGQPFVLPPVMPRGTEFQQRVWQGLQNIPRGATVTYGELAAAIGHPRAARAVGAACAANPVPLLIPCHRVIASGGKHGGFSAGIKRKILLLESESQQPKAI